MNTAWFLCYVGACSLLVSAQEAVASELLSAAPLTDRIVLLHFDDGYVIHHKRGMPRTAETAVVNPLDVAAAGRCETYRLVSTEDPAYQQGRSPERVGRKSKGTDFGWFMERWENGHAVNSKADHAKEHWVYLFFREPLKRGITYQLNTAALATNGSQWKLVLNETCARSEAVHVNLEGYVPSAPRKFGYVYQWMGDAGSLDVKPFEGAAFRVLDEPSRKEVFRGTVTFRTESTHRETAHLTDSPPAGNFLKTDVCECDFSSFKTPGKYVLEVDGVGCSFPFRLNEDVYRNAFRTVTRGLYHNRSGLELKQPFTEFTRPAPHNPKLTPGFAGKLLYTSVRFTEWGSEGGDAQRLLAAAKGPLDCSGWYQDAGDWDSYYTHLRVAQELLFAFEMAPANFRDGELNIPESGNGVPDILDEAAWLPRFCYRLRHELLDRKYGTGGIGLRIAGDAFGSDEKKLPDGRVVGQGSWEDVDRTWAASGEDPWSAYRYAGAAAHLAYCLNVAHAKDPERVDWRREALEAFAWAKQNSRPGDEELKDPPLRLARLYAAAALFRLTGQAAYQDQYLSDAEGVLKDSSNAWNDAMFGVMLFALGGGDAKYEAAAQKRAKDFVIAASDHMLDTAEKRALRWGGNWWMPMVIGQQTTPWLLPAAAGCCLTRDSAPAKSAQIRAMLYTTCDYFLGCNALNQTWVTGLGPRYPVNLFHMDGWYNGKERVHPGLIPYGPSRKAREIGAGPWDTAWAYKTVYPPIDEWPGNERFFENRCCPGETEFTIHQNLAPAAAIFGFLCAP